MQELSVQVRKKRGSRGIRSVAAEIGVSHTTLARIESGKQPDLTTFGKVCKWLGVDPNSILGFQSSSDISSEKGVAVQAHFRAHQTMSAETAQHLANLILAVQEASKKGL